MRILPFLLLLSLAAPLAAEPIYKADKAQGETALRMIHDGETIRLYCKPCYEVVYTAVSVSSRQLQPFGDGFRLLVNGEPVDLTTVYVDDGFADGWENLATLLGFVVDDVVPKLSPALDEDSRLAARAGYYTGTIDGTDVVVELRLEGRKLTGAYFDEQEKGIAKLLATGYNAARKSETLALLERDGEDRVVATWRGDFDPAGDTFTGTRTHLDGSQAQPFELVHEAR